MKTAIRENMELVSVIIPMYNAGKTIIRTLDSVKNQKYTGDFEIIIVDDGSTDQSAELVKTYILENGNLDIRLIQQRNSGVSTARNVGMKEAHGNFIALLDADDEWLPEKTERQMKYFSDPDLKIDFLVSLWNNERLTFPYFIERKTGLVKISLKQLLLKITGQTSTAIFRKEVLQKTGFFDEKQKYSEDANFWMRVTEHYNMMLVPERLVLAGGGKKSFGVSGLSANLKEMEKGIQKNIREMYHSGRISFVEYLFYYTVSKLKYAIRPFR